MEKMTPMKRYSGSMQEMRENLKSHFNEIILHKSEPKYNRADYTTTKGVESDFIIIFSEPKQEVSLALTFDYIDLEDKDHRVTASIKKWKNNNKMEVSQAMPLPEFKEKLNQFNKSFKEIFKTQTTSKMQLNSASIVNKFSEFFLERKLDWEKELNEKQEKLNQLHQTISAELKIPETRKIKILAIENLNKAQEQVKKEITESEDFKNLLLIKKQVVDLEMKLSTITTNLGILLKVKELKRMSDIATENLIVKEYELEKKVALELNKIPKFIQKKSTTKF